MRSAISAAIVAHVVLGARPVAAYCYYDAYGRYYCTNSLSYGARIGISIGVLILSLLLVSLCILQRKRRARAQNAMLLANQQRVGGPPPGGFQQPYGTPYGAPPNNGYPAYPNNTGPQPFQPGYAGGYMNNAPGPGGMHPEAKNFGAGTPGYGYTTSPPPGGVPPEPKAPGAPGAPGAPVNVTEPPRSYNPDQPYVPVAPVNTGGYSVDPNEPPQYSGYVPPAGPPPSQHQTGSNNPYTYNPPDTSKV